MSGATERRRMNMVSKKEEKSIVIVTLNLVRGMSVRGRTDIGHR
jgi:hypothetical protein